MAQKWDGVIEGVRYTPEGMVEVARLYERRGATFSDRVLWTRAELVEKLRAKKRLAIGARIPLLASTFEIKGLVRLEGGIITSARQPGERDLLEGAPLF